MNFIYLLPRYSLIFLTRQYHFQKCVGAQLGHLCLRSHLVLAASEARSLAPGDVYNRENRGRDRPVSCAESVSHYRGPSVGRSRSEAFIRIAAGLSWARFPSFSVDSLGVSPAGGGGARPGFGALASRSRSANSLGAVMISPRNCAAPPMGLDRA